ncbi:ent-kaur-16-ene synthase, chloroplastic-like isoform X1 [Ananas comosus]|uniref:Ent-kaur-16-ene synthase, chloroplastic-like isoform X1 n=1 Tax=Ananas comosus TaxID=4615 RepID=A0A6P5G4Q6_ANACO|nr:ent-kaur-16-ene synthase, chloroplastic-like isoform X1 [Ananas comosus]
MSLNALSFPLCCIQSTDIQISRVRAKKTVRASLPRVSSANLDDAKVANSANLSVMCSRESEKRIREQLSKVEYSVSSYDTAWVAMVPSPGSPQTPCFPQCVDWMLQNQNSNGSWGLDHIHPSLMKDALSSTLACVLALKRWNVGEEHVRRGLRYIGSNLSCIKDENYQSPVGFNIIFPGMLERAIDLGLDIPIRQHAIQDILCLRDLELKRDSANNSEGRKAYMAYVSEGLGNLQDWNEVMKYQRKNGSLFNSPATTAVALTHRYDVKALDYLHAILRRFGSSVPTVYPFEMHTQLCMVDTLEKLGISRLFAYEIKTILDRIYRCWLENDEELSLDMAACAMAFCLLRMNGYDVSSDRLSHYAEAHNFHNSMQGYLKDMKTVLEFHKASQIKILDCEQVLDKLGSWSSSFLKEEVSSNSKHSSRVISQEADYVLKFPFYANLERLEHKRNIEHFDVANYQILKTSYKSFWTSDDLLKLAVEDFSSCQSIYRKELQHLQSWVRENRLDQLGFARDKITYCYLSAAATLCSPELTDGRILWAKNSLLTTVVDDFFDVGGSIEELKNLISLVEKWDGNHEKEFCSEHVEIIFSALHSTINELGAKASAVQNRSVTGHLVEIWLSMMRSMMNEAEWLRKKTVPTTEQYMENGIFSLALGPTVLSLLYIVGPKLSEEAIADPEYHELFRLVSTCGRLLNDVQGYEVIQARECKEGKLNSISLRVVHSDSSISVEEAQRELKRSVETSRRELLRLVLKEGSVIPRSCKDLFWKMCRILHLFYMNTDGFTSAKEMVSAVNAVIHEPLKISHLLSAIPGENTNTNS